MLAISTSHVAGHDDPPAPEATAIVVAADPEQRSTLGRLATEARVAVVGDARDARDCVSAARRLRPDVAVLHLDAPRTEALAAASGLAARSPLTRVVLMTAHRDVAFLRAALAAGVAAYVPAAGGSDALGAALAAALQGQAALPAPLVRELADGAGHGPGPSGELLARLTPRELDVLRHVADGLTNAEIAGRLHVSAGTVKVHVERLIGKLGVGNRTQAAVHAARAGLLGAA